MILSDELKRIIRLTAMELKLTEAVVEVVYRDYWKFIRDTFSNIPLKEITTEEEFNQYKTSINLPSLGKMYTTWDKVEKYRRRRYYVNKIFEENDTIKEN